MKSILLIIENPAHPSPEEEQAWGRIVSKISEQLNLYENMTKISENSLLIAVDNELPAFVNVVSSLQVEKFSYQVLFLGEDQKPVRYQP